MKRYKFINSISGCVAVAASCLLLFSSCTGNFEEMNTDPDKLTDEELSWDFNNLSFITQMEANIVPTGDVTANDFQRAQNLVGDIWSGHQAAIGDWNASSNNSTYNLSYAQWNDVGFNVAYDKVMAGWYKMKKEAGTEFPHALALATIIKVAGLHRIADNYGPIPYSQFGSAIKIPYDSQQEVYAQFFQELTDAIADLELFVKENPGATPMYKFDLIYAGDYTKWIKYANSLMLRLAMRIRFADAAMAETYAKQAIAGGVISSNDESAVVKSYRSISIFNPLNVCWDSYSDTRMGANMDVYLNGYNDDRRSKYFSMCVDNTSALPEGQKPTGYFGVRNGIPQHNKQNFVMMSSPITKASDPVYIMTAAEVKFLLAEAALIGWYTGETAQSLYEAGIAASFQQWGLSLPSTYLTGTTVPGNFVDRSMNPTKYSWSSAASYLVASVSWTDRATTDEARLQKIITQKWIALYPDGQEAWSEFRRTTYPRLIPINTNNSGGTITTSTSSVTYGVSRQIYPTAEYNGNYDNVKAAVDILIGESKGYNTAGDNGGVRVWWDKKR